jgi:methylated-DNA-[protein]-cysteine S-methyltransferase
MTKSVLFVQTPLDTMTLVETDGAISELRFGERTEDGERLQSTPLLRKAEAELKEYFSGARKTFSIPLAPRGTAFQRAVWNALEKIPYGATASYGDIAKQIGNPKAARAVGMANNKNPLPIFIPCHRVIGADGGMAGYGAGLDKKKFLLALEEKQARR